MSNLTKDISNQKFGELIAICATGKKTNGGNAIWKCLCSCGNITYVAEGQLKSGRTKSCGCLRVKSHKKTNQYDLSNDYCIGFANPNHQKFFIDKDDYDRVKEYNWNIRNGYLRAWSGFDNGREELALHRFVLGITDSKVMIDHINGNTLDNRKSNLRIATSSQNGINKLKNKNNTTGYKGVSRNGKGFMARIKKDYKTYYLGTYPTAEEANAVRIKAEKEMFGEFYRPR